MNVREKAILNLGGVCRSCFTKTEYRRVWWNTEEIKTPVDKAWISDMKNYSG